MSSLNSIQNLFADIKLIAFDADDTLWDNQTHFEEVERQYCDILSAYGSAPEVSDALFETETRNMALLGYGCKAFAISLVENAINFSQNRISATDILRIVDLGKSLLSLHATPLPGVVETLESIRSKGKYKMVVFTKGELLDQQNKLDRSRLTPFFDDIVIVSDKTQAEYRKLCRMCDTDISQLLMVGNSFKSDIDPVLQLGGYAIHIPFHTTWKHESVSEYDHNHLWRIEQFEQLTKML